MKRYQRFMLVNTLCISALGMTGVLSYAIVTAVNDSAANTVADNYFKEYNSTQPVPTFQTAKYPITGASQGQFVCVPKGKNFQEQVTIPSVSAQPFKTIHTFSNLQDCVTQATVDQNASNLIGN